MCRVAKFGPNEYFLPHPKHPLPPGLVGRDAYVSGDAGGCLGLRDEARAYSKAAAQSFKCYFDVLV